MTESKPAVAHVVEVVEETMVGTVETGTPAVTDIKISEEMDYIHPDVADKLRQKYNVTDRDLSKCNIYVVADRFVAEVNE